jgi:hypothetical protein
MEKEKMEKIEQRHRLIGASKIPIVDKKSEEIRKKIIEGLSDDHPVVQAAAFYERTARS